MGPLLPLTTRWRRDRETSPVAVPGLPSVARAVAGAVSSDSSADIDGAGLVTDLSSIMCTLPR